LTPSRSAWPHPGLDFHTQPSLLLTRIWTLPSRRSRSLFAHSPHSAVSGSFRYAKPQTGSGGIQEGAPASRLFAVTESVASEGRFHLSNARCSLGLLALQVDHALQLDERGAEVEITDRHRYPYRPSRWKRASSSASSMKRIVFGLSKDSLLRHVQFLFCFCRPTTRWLSLPRLSARTCRPPGKPG